MKSELQTFDGLDNRREVMILLQRLGSCRLDWIITMCLGTFF